MMANRLDRIRWRKFVLARVHQTHLKSVGERQAKQAITHEIYDVRKAMRITPLKFANAHLRFSEL